MYQHILLPTDGSDQSEQTIERGLQFAKLMGARVTGLHVVVESNVAAGIGKSLRREDEAVGTARDFLARINAAARRAGVACESFYLAAGSPAEGIAQAADKRGCDLIFMHSHAHGGLSRLPAASEAVQVLHGSKVPVLIHR